VAQGSGRARGGRGGGIRATARSAIAFVGAGRVPAAATAISGQPAAGLALQRTGGQPRPPAKPWWSRSIRVGPRRDRGRDGVVQSTLRSCAWIRRDRLCKRLAADCRPRRRVEASEGLGPAGTPMRRDAGTAGVT
jgi:hypothetical protein